MSVEQNNNSDQQWKKRLKLVQIIYSKLVDVDLTNSSFVEKCINTYNLELDQLKVIEYFLSYKNDIILRCKDYIKQNWTFNQLNLVDQAIIFQSVAEQQVWKTPKKIIIDQALITCKKFSDQKNYKFLNAILDKIL